MLAGFDEDVQIFSKVGLSWRPDSSGPVHVETIGEDGERRTVYRDSRAVAIRQDVEESLQRLGLEQLDLAQVHFRDTDTPIPDTMQALRALREEGKIRAIGVSNFNLQEVREAAAALAPVPLAAVQIRLNLLQQAPLAANELVDWCRSRNTAVLAYSPLAEGRLAIPPADDPQKMNAIDAARTELAELCAEAELPMAAVGIAWLTSRPGVTGAIAGASTPEQLDGLMQMADVPGDLLRRASEIFKSVRLLDPWERPFWKRKLRGLIRRIR